MKVYPIAVIFLSTLQVASGVAPISHCDGLANKECGDLDGCLWIPKDKTCVENHDSDLETCKDRNGNDCEDLDDKCVRIKNECVEVSRGSGVEGDSCSVSLVDDGAGNLLYAENEGVGCATDHVCIVEDTYTSTELDTPLLGTCQPTQCYGRKVAGNCSENKPGCERGTKRVTICHRTCSETNPWVRITIDDDAWKTCGHMQHTIDPTCNGKDLSIWGANKNDYLIKDHGTRDEVAATLNKQDEKAYWRKWEHACPYVRNGECCDWTDENPCCGEPPKEVDPPLEPEPTPKSPSTCSEVQEELYAVNDVIVSKNNPLGGFDTVDHFPVKVLSTDGKTVTFEVCNKLGNGRVFTGFIENDEYVCYESDEGSDASVPDSCVEYTADCYVTEPFAVVDIHLTEPVLYPPIVDVPKCCHDDTTNPLSAVYTFVLRCECPAAMS